MHDKKNTTKPLTTAVAHILSTTRFLDYVLLPYGIYYAPENKNVKAGDFMRFMSGESVEVVNAFRVSTDEPIAEMLSQARYGVPISVLMEKLTDNAAVTGNEKQISQDEIICVYYKPFQKQEL